MPEAFEIRAATVANAAVIARHRARMFQDMGLVPGPLFESYRAQCETRLREMLASGEYLGWLGFPIADPEKIVAGVGVHCGARFPIRWASRVKRSRWPRAAMPL